MRYDLIIFDVDGTLWNACETTAKGINNALKKLHIPKKFTTHDIEKYSGEPRTRLFGILLTMLKTLYPSSLTILDDREKAAIISEGGTLYDGVTEGLRQLSNSSKLALVSNCQDWYMECFIDFADMRTLISAYNSFGASHMPKSDMIKLIAKKMQAKHIVYIGDTHKDLVAAEQAGVDFIGARYGFGNIKGAKVAFDSFQEIVDHLLKS